MLYTAVGEVFAPTGGNRFRGDGNHWLERYNSPLGTKFSLEQTVRILTQDNWTFPTFETTRSC